MKIIDTRNPHAGFYGVMAEHTGNAIEAWFYASRFILTFAPAVDGVNVTPAETARFLDSIMGRYIALEVLEAEKPVLQMNIFSDDWLFIPIIRAIRESLNSTPPECEIPGC